MMEMVLHPRFEIESRIKRLQSRMGDLDGAVILDSVDVAYFAGTGQEGLIYIPRDGQAVMMARKSLSRAAMESPLPVRPLRSLKDLRSELRIQPGSALGLELDVIPFNHYTRLMRVLDGCKAVDVSETIRHLRSVKSEFEIGLTRQAANMVDAGLACVPDHLTEGMREIELSSWVEKTMRDLGHQGAIRFRRYNHFLPLGHLMAGENAAIASYVASPTGGQGVSLLQPQGAGFRRIGRNEPVLVDFAGVYNGYTADETRIFSIGPLPRHLEEAHAAALQVEEVVASQLLSGRTGRELFDIAESEGARLGYGDHLGGPPGSKCGFVGHGVGLEIDEPPVLGPTDHRIVPGMTIAVEPKMIFPATGVVGIEDTFLTTEGRPIRLTGFQSEIWQV
ncbi:MAG: Xaa-Pro dipeptidase [Methanosaeta sp. PtaB.Bin039]|nr:MAG: Xaa-Pro dipeptidase [Methanosaeta sp. PtaB.Bin039]OPY47306.1 MAG: Xaa-Pro dipeptidase [Methanosaeta sp. PtaU1.Bin028]HQJ28399.1 Xaa-Pro peptidase family protein [Methanotrichaceae archaeon]